MTLPDPSQPRTEDSFNTLGIDIVRDNSNRVNTNADLVRAVNDYDYTGSWAGRTVGILATALSLGGYYASQRKVVRPGHFGHYVSSGRHMLVPPGIHSLVSTTDTWAVPYEVPMDDEDRAVRTFGSKTLLICPENHVGGAFRIGKHADDREDGEFVLMLPGRHVLPEENYRQVQVVQLEAGRVQLGPITLLWVKENFLGGAYRRATGVYEVFNPGAPYCLHAKHWDDIEVVERRLDVFRLGPLTFVTVLEGQLAGAFEKGTGQYRILPPGHTYQLHNKEYEGLQVVERADNFRLGPYYFITVQDGWVAGAYAKKTGRWVPLPAGASYQLNVEEWMEPKMSRRDTHVVTVGPLTYLTTRPDTLSGAFRVDDGAWVEFDEDGKEYVLHNKEYHSVTSIGKYSNRPQTFGPNVVVTIPDGAWGIMTRMGTMEIKKPGYYKVSSEYTVLPSIPSNTFTSQFDQHQFKSKDGILMDVTLNMVWRVSDPQLVALFPGSFEELRATLGRTVLSNLVKQCMSYNREQLLPTQQDIMAGRGSDLGEEELAALVAAADDAKAKLYSSIEGVVLTTLQERSKMGSWGLEIVSVLVEGFRLLDEGIIADLAGITRSIIATKAEKVKGELSIAQAEAEKEANKKRAEASGAVRIQEAQAAAEVQETEARALAKARVVEAKAERDMQVLEASSKAKADAEARSVQLEISTREKRESAQAEADAIKLLAAANHEKAMKEAEAAAAIPPQQVQLEQARYAVEALEKLGAAAWRHPEPMMEALDQLKPFLRLGSTSLADLPATRGSAGH